MSLRTSLKTAKNDLGVSLKAVNRLLTTPPPSTIPALLPGLPESFSQLLQKLHQDVTALSLSFKPPITEKAAIAQLEKVSESYGRVAACVVAATGGQTGGALVEEWRDGAESIGSEILRLIDVFADVEAREGNTGSSSEEENPYLLHTGLVWDSIDHLSKSLSSDEVMAVGKRWKGQTEVIKDAWNEFKDFLEDQDSEEGDGDEERYSEPDSDDVGGGNDEDDDFADLQEMMSGGKMTAEERARAERAKSQLGLHQILHATIPRYLSALSLDPEEPYTNILNASSALAAAFDTAIAALYPDQEVDEININLADLAARSRDLVKILESRLARSAANAGAGDACKSFLQKWSDRLDREEDQWRSGSLSLSALESALPAK